jgi:hypothetical protein
MLFRVLKFKESQKSDHPPIFSKTSKDGASFLPKEKGVIPKGDHAQDVHNNMRCCSRPMSSHKQHHWFSYTPHMDRVAANAV